MRAAVGDWLVVRSHATGRYSRRREILTVGADGAPPYTVRWTDSDRQVLVFPGSDAEVVTAVALAAQNRAQERRIASVQSSISDASR
jgi:hypothetical protein